jgi:hypothetical protein
LLLNRKWLTFEEWSRSREITNQGGSIMSIELPTMDLTFEGVSLIAAFLVLLSGLVFKGWKATAQFIGILLLMFAFGFFLKNFGGYADKLNHLATSTSSTRVVLPQVAQPSADIEEERGPAPEAASVETESTSVSETEQIQADLESTDPEFADDITSPEDGVSSEQDEDGWRKPPWRR